MILCKSLGPIRDTRKYYNQNQYVKVRRSLGYMKPLKRIRPISCT